LFVIALPRSFPEGRMPEIVIADYATLRLAIAERRKALGLRQAEVDHIAGIAAGYTGKVECGMKYLGDISLGPILGAIGAVLVLVPATGQYANLGGKTTQISNEVRERWRARASKGAAMQRARMTPEERVRMARKAIRARWDKVANQKTTG
jgi:hypothetical protein